MLETKNKPLVAVHRGTPGGMISENTVKSGLAAIYCGADIIEIDIVRSTDGDFYVFHDGYELKKFGLDQNINTLSTREIESLRYRLHGDDTDPETVTPLAEMILSLPEGTIFNVDRSWRFWDTLLPYLDQFEIEDRTILKCPPSEELLQKLSKHEVKYPLIPMVKSLDDIELVGNYPGVNTVGFEVLTSEENHVFVESDFIGRIQELGYLVFVNAINLENAIPLYAGWDDAKSLAGSVENGWGKLVDLGADIIQTDWPALLTYYLGRPLNFPQRSKS